MAEEDLQHGFAFLNTPILVADAQREAALGNQPSPHIARYIETASLPILVPGLAFRLQSS